MTKKDYVLIARRINTEGEYHKMMMNSHKSGERQHAMSARIAIQALAESLAEDLLKDNPSFDADKFLNACGTKTF